MPLYAPQIERVKDPALHAKTKANPGHAACAKRQFDQALRNLKLLSDGGVMIAMGTDSGTGTRPLAGLLRARRDGADGEGRHDADADARRRDRQRREGDEHRQAKSARFSRASAPTSWC